MDTLPPLDALRAFLAAARLGSLSAAAVELGVTHGAISRRVHAVERWLGARLFDRHGRGVRPTPIAENFARRVDRALNGIVALAADIRAANATETLRLSMLPSFARLWLMPRMQALQGDPVDLAIRIMAEHRIASLDKREADIAIRFGSGAWPGVDTTLLLTETLVPVATPEIAVRLVHRDTNDLLHETLLHDSDARDWRSWCRAAGISYRPLGGERRFEDYDLVLAAAEAGLGVALARRPLADGAIASGRLAILAGPILLGDRSHYVVTRSGESRTGVLRLRQRLLTAAQPALSSIADAQPGN